MVAQGRFDSDWKPRPFCHVEKSLILRCPSSSHTLFHNLSLPMRALSSSTSSDKVHSFRRKFIIFDEKVLSFQRFENLHKKLKIQDTAFDDQSLIYIPGFFYLAQNEKSPSIRGLRLLDPKNAILKLPLI